MTDTVIRVGDAVVTLINVFDVDAARQQELVDLLSEGTEQVVRHRPGFVSVSLHASTDGTRVVNYAQWRSQDDVAATMADPDVQAVAMRAAAIGTPVPHAYVVVAVHR